MNDLFEIKQDEITLRCEATEMEEGQGSIYIEEYVPDIEADKKLLIYGGLVPTKALNITVKSLALLHEAGGSFSAYFCVDRLLEKKCKNKLVKNELDGCCFYAEGAKALEILTKLCGYVLFMPEDRLDCFMLCSSENVSLKDGVLTPINTNECRMITCSPRSSLWLCLHLQPEWSLKRKSSVTLPTKAMTTSPRRSPTAPTTPTTTRYPRLQGA